MIPDFDEVTGRLPPGDHSATMAEITKRFGFTPRRRWLLRGLRTAVNVFRAAKWRMWADHGVEFFIHPVMRASVETGFPEFFRHDRDGQRQGVIHVVKAAKR